MSSRVGICTDIFDVRSLDTLSEFAYNAVKELVLDPKLQINVHTNTIALSLMRNHFIGGKPTPKKIVGPLMLTKMVKDAKTAYIFGEAHGSVSACSDNMTTTSIDKFLRRVLDTTDVFIDFFVESRSHVRWWDARTIYIEKVVELAQMCIRDPEGCRWKNVARVHWTDIRNKDISSLYKLASQIHTGEAVDTDLLQTLYDNINSIDDLLDYIEDTEMEAPLLKKELERSYKRQEIVNWFNRVIADYFEKDNRLKEFRTMMKDVLNGRPVDREKNYFLIISSYVKDMYTLARVFKRFNIEDTGVLRHPIEPTNIIMYYGYNHAVNYIDFLTQDGWTIEGETSCWDKLEHRCLDFEGTDLLPLFGESGDIPSKPSTEPEVLKVSIKDCPNPHEEDCGWREPEHGGCDHSAIEDVTIRCLDSVRLAEDIDGTFGEEVADVLKRLKDRGDPHIDKSLIELALEYPDATWWIQNE